MKKSLRPNPRASRQSLIIAIFGVFVAAAVATGIRWPAEAQGIGSATSSVVVIAALWYARRQVQEAKGTRDDQKAKPLIVVEFDVFRKPHMIYLMINNYGNAVALNTKVTFDPPLESSFESERGALSKLGIFRDGIPVLAPAGAIPVLFDSFFQRNGHADMYKATVEYEDTEGNLHRNTWTLDLTIYSNIEYIAERTLTDIDKRLESIAKSLDSFSKSRSGIRVVTSADLAAEQKIWEERRAQMERSEELENQGKMVT